MDIFECREALESPHYRADSRQTLDARLTAEPCSIPGLRDFLRTYPLMAFRPRPGKPFLVRGRFQFLARHPDAGEVEDVFELEIDVPTAFPRDIPQVTETAGRIPRTSGFHVNQTDGTLCLGSPLRLLSLLSAAPTLSGFSEKCLVPYLFGISQKLRTGRPLPFGELDHGSEGSLRDYQGLFGLDSPDKARMAIYLLGLKKRIANKHPCPCGCRCRLGRCPFNRKLSSFRQLASRCWFRAEFVATSLSKKGLVRPEHRKL
jgi:hypothetical protein